VGIVRSKIYDYHIWDARKIGEKIKKKMVDVVITSPPYWNLKNYDVDNQIGFGQKYDEYLADLQNVFRECSNVVKDTGSLWIIVDTLKVDGKVKTLPFDLAHEIEEWWKLQDIIIWHKDKTLPWSSKGKLRNIFEYILFFTKSSDFKYHPDKVRDPDDIKKWWIKYPERYNPNGKMPDGVWRISIPMQGWGNGWVRHFCPFPPALVERILLLTTDEGDVVLDPFAGSGSVLAQAKVMGRKPIGFDLNENYKKMYEEKVLPTIKERWKTRRKEIKELEKRREKLKVAIRKLRQLKYPKEVVKGGAKSAIFEGIGSRLNTIFVIGKESKDHKPTPDIYFVFDSKVDRKVLSSNLGLLRSKPPLSLYGINPRFKIYTRGTVIKTKKKLFEPENLFLYSRGTTHYYKQNITFSQWAKLSNEEVWEEHYKDGVPPILSNIGICQKDTKLGA